MFSIDATSQLPDVAFVSLAQPRIRPYLTYQWVVRANVICLAMICLLLIMGEQERQHVTELLWEAVERVN